MRAGECVSGFWPGRLKVTSWSELRLWAADKGFIGVGVNEPLAPAHTHTPPMAHKNTDTQKAWGFYTLWTWGTPRNRPVLLHLQRNQYIPSLYLLYRFIRPSSLLFGGLGALDQQCVLNTRVDLAVSRWQQSGFCFFLVCLNWAGFAVVVCVYSKCELSASWEARFAQQSLVMEKDLATLTMIVPCCANWATGQKVLYTFAALLIMLNVKKFLFLVVQIVKYNMFILYV